MDLIGAKCDISNAGALSTECLKFCSVLNKPLAGARPTSLCYPPCDSCGWMVSSRTSVTSKTIMGGLKIRRRLTGAHMAIDTHTTTGTFKQLPSINSTQTHTLTSLSQSACMCEVLYLGLGTASRYFVLSVFHCSSDQKPWRPLACTHTQTHKQTTPQ